MRTADSTTPVRGSKTAQPSCHALPPTQQQVKELGHPRVQGPDRAVRVAIGRTASPPCSTPRSPLPDLGSHPHQGGVRGRTAPSPPAGRRSCLPLRGGKKNRGPHHGLAVHGSPCMKKQRRGSSRLLARGRSPRRWEKEKREKERESERGRESERESESENESESVSVSVSVSGSADVSVYPAHERERERVYERERACARTSASSLASMRGQGRFLSSLICFFLSSILLL